MLPLVERHREKQTRDSYTNQHCKGDTERDGDRDRYRETETGKN